MKEGTPYRVKGGSSHAQYDVHGSSRMGIIPLAYPLIYGASPLVAMIMAS